MSFATGIKCEWVPVYTLPRIIDGVPVNNRGYLLVTPNAWAWRPAKSIVASFERYLRDSGPDEAYAFGIGIPYIAGTSRLMEADVRACCSDSLHWTQHATSRPLVVGADQGDHSHHVVMCEPAGPDGIIKILFADELKGNLFDVINADNTISEGLLSQLRRDFCPSIAVIDAMPNIENSFNVCKRAGGFIWRVYYVASLKTPVHWKLTPGMYDDKDHSYVVTANQTANFDLVARLFRERKILLPPLDKHPRGIGTQIIKQLCKPVRVRRDSSAERSPYIWQDTKTAHIFNALVYALIGCQGIDVNIPQRVINPLITPLSTR